MIEIPIIDVPPFDAAKVIAGIELAYAYRRDVVKLQRRGIDRRIVADLAVAGVAARAQVDVLLGATEPPPARSWPCRIWLRVRVAFGAPDPDEAWRARVARFIEAFNRGAA